MALDNNNTPYVAFSDVANGGRATVMKFNGIDWVNVGNPGFSAGSALFISIALDSNDTPYVSYEDTAYNYRATVMKFDCTSWIPVGTPGFSTGEVLFTSIAFDNFNTPYVAYSDFANGVKATVMKFNGANWVSAGMVAFSPSNAFDVTLALDSNNILYIAYHDASNNVVVMKYTGSSWETVGCPIGGQQGSADGSVLCILADEARIIRCLRTFFCETLEQISNNDCLTLENKVNIAKELINAAAKKESALAEVLEAASKFITR